MNKAQRWVILITGLSVSFLLLFSQDVIPHYVKAWDEEQFPKSDPFGIRELVFPYRGDPLGLADTTKTDSSYIVHHPAYLYWDNLMDDPMPGIIIVLILGTTVFLFNTKKSEFKK